MDVLNKKASLPIDSSLVKDISISSDGLDGIFAELFSLVDLSSIEANKVTNANNQTNLLELNSEEVVNDDNSIMAAKSLISIFLKDNPLPNLDDNKLVEGLKKELSGNENENYLVHYNKGFEIIDEKKIRSLLPNKKKTESLSLKDIYKFVKNFESWKNLKNNKIKTNNNFNLESNNTNLVNKNNVLVKNKNSEFKKKNLNNNINNLKIQVQFLDDDGPLNNNKTIELQNINRAILKPTKENPSNLSLNNENFNSSKANNFETQITRNLHNNIPDKQFLDLLESGWGEKFVKSLKTNIENGKNKFDFTIKPKNLGKLKVEINFEDGKTNVKINTENKAVAYILNENQNKINELLNKESGKIEDNNFLSSQNNNGNKQKEKKESIFSQKKIDNRIDDKGKNQPKKKIHKVDINA